MAVNFLKMKKILKKMVLTLLIFLLVICGYFFIGPSPEVKKISWGVNFSQKHAENLGLDWKETYLALLNDLKVKKIKIASYWDLIEPEERVYNFEDLDWQVEKAEEKGTEILLVIGMKSPRWPECHIPFWAKELKEEEQKEKILILIREIVLRYKEKSFIFSWQVENEPFFPFGECPWTDKNFLKKEVALVKSLDSSHPIIISESGEGSLWIQAAQTGDIVGITMYKKVWVKEIRQYFTYFFPPISYYRKSKIVEKLFGKKVICVELQAEPWGPKLLYDCPIEEQLKTMNLEQFQKNIEFAQKTGFDTFYLWGAEWWYWLKEVHNQPEIWNKAKQLFDFGILS